MWTILILSLPIPAWSLFPQPSQSSMGAARRRFLDKSAPALADARFAVLSAIGSLTGVLVASFDIEFPLNRSRWQWFVALWILLPVVSLMAVFTR